MTETLEPGAVPERDTTHLLRQLDIIPLEVLGQPITVIGCGAIGSFAILSLAKMGFTEIIAYDFDEVGLENMNCQFYRRSDCGKNKATALKSLVHDFTGEWINAKAERWAGQPLAGIVITAVDSMEVRKAVWEHCRGNPNVQWFIDPRMSAEYAVSFVSDPNDEKDIVSYERTLHTDDNSVQERCTAKATMYTATMIAGYVAKHVKDVVMREPYARITHWDIKGNQLSNWGKPTPAAEQTVTEYGKNRFDL